MTRRKLRVKKKAGTRGRLPMGKDRANGFILERADVKFQVALLNYAFDLYKKIAERRRRELEAQQGESAPKKRGKGPVKRDFATAVFARTDSVKTMNQCLTIQEDGTPVRRLSIGEVFRAAKLVGLPIWKLCHDVAVKMELEEYGISTNNTT